MRDLNDTASQLLDLLEALYTSESPTPVGLRAIEQILDSADSGGNITTDTDWVLNDVLRHYFGTSYSCCRPIRISGVYIP